MTRAERALLAIGALAALGSALERSWADGWLGEALAASPAPVVRLVGFGCQGAAGPLYAAEESDFPQCRAIEPL